MKAQHDGPHTWAAERLVGSPLDMHGLSWPDVPRRLVRVVEVNDRAIVLGSSQRRFMNDLAGSGNPTNMVIRKSGGGAVLVEPGQTFWFDVLIPASDALWVRDVSRSTWWLGEVWVRTLSSLGFEELDFHRGPLIRNAWSDLLCFAGLGPGEVTAGGRKVVGISQRRTRFGAIYQCGLMRAWDPKPLLGALGLDLDASKKAEFETSDSALGIGSVSARSLEQEFLANLP